MTPADWSPVRPEWSPDGTRLVFAKDMGRDAQIQVLELEPHHVTHVSCGYMPSWWDDRTLFLEAHGPCRETPVRAAVLHAVAEE